MTDKQCAKLIEIANHYGITSQLGVLAEECAELTKEALKIVRQINVDKTLISKNPIMGEIADVLIMMSQIQILLDINPIDINKMIDYKLNRQIKRIKGREQIEA